jgi:starch synthase
VNYLKAGLHFADQINAVSPGYAAELLTPEGAHGLHDYFRRRAADLRGIVNGCDYRLWNPAVDPFLPAAFSETCLCGKSVCKTRLQDAFGLPASSAAPLLGMMCRLTRQKGFDFLLPVLRQILHDDVQCVVLGIGDPAIERELHLLAQAFPGKAAYRNEFSEPLAHLLCAGSDLFLMPSLFEPCGFAQMYCLRYGTPPIVRAVGGLNDTVQDCALGAGTGFVFAEPNAAALMQCLRRALEMFHHQPEQFRALIRRGMRQRFDWLATASRYVRLYLDALERR